MERNITLCLNLLLGDGTVEIGIDEKILIDLPKIDESLNFENILTMQIDKLNELKELLIVNMTSLIVSNMIENYASLNLDQNIIQDILYLFFKYAFEQENGKKNF